MTFDGRYIQLNKTHLLKFEGENFENFHNFYVNQALFTSILMEKSKTFR